MAKDYQAIEKLEAYRRHDEEVHGGDAVDMVLEESLPSLGRRPMASHHGGGNGRLRDLNSKLEQFAMKTWGAPEWIRQAHFTDQPTEFLCNPRAASRVIRLPTPIDAEALTMPSNNLCG